MKQENNNTSRVQKYSNLREEITGSKSEAPKHSIKNVKKEPISGKKVVNNRVKTSTKTVTVPINVNKGMNTDNISLEKDENSKNPQIYDSYKKRRTFKVILYFIGIAIVFAAIILVLVLIFRK